MKKKINVMVSVLLCMMSVLAVYRSVSYIVTMAEGGNAVEAVEIPKKDRSKEIGTKENPFLLLEIVPNKAMATVSYLFAGCEPVDMEKVGYSREGNYLLTTVGITPGLIKSEKVTEYVFEEELPADIKKPTKTDDNLIGEWISSDTDFSGSCNGTEGKNYAEYGYYEYVGEGKGKFQVDGKAFSYAGNGMGSYQWVKTASYAYVGETNGNYNGNYNRVETEEGVVEFQEVGEGNGKYQKKMFLDGEEENTEGRFWMLRTDEQYYRMHHYEYTNPDYLLENAFGRTAKDGFVSKAVVITPDQLTGDNLKLIDEADMIAISAWDDSQNKKTELWELFNKEKASLNATEKSQQTFTDRKDAKGNDVKGNDLSWEATLRIVKRMASDNPPGMMLDQDHTYRNDGVYGAYNVGKLYIMLMQYGAKRFKERYMDDSILAADGLPRLRKEKGALGVLTGYYESPYLTYSSDVQEALKQKTTWDQNTFTTGPASNETNEQNKFLMDCVNMPSGGVDAKDTVITYNGGLESFWNMRTTKIFASEYYSGCNSEMVDYFLKEGKKEKELTFNDGYAFILRGLKAGQTECKEYKKQFRILELQPCTEFIYGNENWKLYYVELFPWFTGDYDKDLSVTTMASWEFNADITDINSEYDMIICGLNQNASNGENGYAYNDPYLGQGKLRYTSLGGLVDTNAWWWEYKKKDDVQAFSSKGSDAYQSNARYSGNDITKKKYEELKDFLAAGKPIVVVEDFYQGEDIDTNKVDQSSYIYKLVTPGKKSGKVVADPMKQALTEKETLFRFGKHSKEALKEALAYENCSLEIAEYPKKYTYEVPKDEDGEPVEVEAAYINNEGEVKTTSVTGIIIAGSVDYLGKDKDGNMQLSYRFTVQGKEEDDAVYGVNLYIDRDGNGIFEGSLKEQKELAAAGQNGMGASNEEKVAKETLKITDETTGKEKINPNKLRAGHTYLLTRSLPDSERGILPWKLELSAQANQSIRSSVINYTCIQKKDSEKTKIKVLQMNLTPDMKNNANTFVNFSDTNTKTGARFAAYLAAVPEFDVQIHYMDNYIDIEDIENIDNDEDKKAALGEIASWEDITNLEEDWNKVKYWSNIFCDTNYTKEEQLKHWKEYLSEIDMLIIGFCDNACFTENEVFYEGFMDFVEQGKGVILSHDLVKDATDYYRHPKNVTLHDPELRTLAGQRRKYYDTTAEEGSEAWNEFCYDKVNLNGKEVSLLPKNDLEVIRKLDGQPMGQHYISTVSSISYDKNGESVEIKRSEYMDNSLRLFMTFGGKDSNKTDRAAKVDEWGWLGSSETIHVEKANQGQITTYPYEIGKNIMVAKTHGQNYQLDLEQSSGGDVTVWFNLTDEQDSDVTLGAKNDGIYSSRSGDAANHYYIYTKGNITYTGLGHSREENLKNPEKASPLTDSEIRLFVNTMIASYRVTPEAPYIEVTNKDVSKNGDEYFLYLLQTGEEKEHKTYTVKFMVNDGGLTADGDSKYYLQYQDSKGNVLNPQPDTTKYKEDTQLELVGADGESPQYRVSNLGEYSFEVPYADILDDDGVAVYNLKLTTKYMRGTKEYSKTRTSRITIYATPLFELN